MLFVVGGRDVVFRAPVEWAGARRGGRTDRNQLLSIAGEKTPRSKGRYRWRRGVAAGLAVASATTVRLARRVCLRYV